MCHCSHEMRVNCVWTLRNAMLSSTTLHDWIYLPVRAIIFQAFNVFFLLIFACYLEIMRCARRFSFVISIVRIFALVFLITFNFRCLKLTAYITTSMLVIGVQLKCVMLLTMYRTCVRLSNPDEYAYACISFFFSSPSISVNVHSKLCKKTTHRIDPRRMRHPGRLNFRAI